ncbi:LysM peptidoglycan-binding domain-containing protein [Paenibacillus sp. GXUN7292]|uniref:LysM peptidoglycan-binding domain-containing protein n=1 Tax=Paenibacillus sp. GXUN7292 TaxID=3422499 RepID=UPI003D7E0816
MLLLIHTVKRGDSLWSLSQHYNAPLQQIAAANGLMPSSTLIIGQAVIIPVEARLSFHRVAAGETLWSIGQLYGVTLQELQEANQLHNPALIVPGQELHIPSRKKPAIEVNGYTELLDSAGASIIDEAGGHLTHLSPFSYRVKMDGSLSELDDSSIIHNAYLKKTMPMMVITNFDNSIFNSHIVHAILNQPMLQQRLIHQTLSIMHARGYTTLHIDFEYVLPQDRIAYNYFLQTVVNALHPYRYKVSTALAPKLYAEQPGSLYEAHDYAAHGQIVDFVILMTYEWGWSGGAPRAVAPINEVVKVLNYALSVIPPEKILMGVPLYGYDWTLPYVKGGRLAQAISSDEAIRRAAEYSAEIQYDTESQSPYYMYIDEHGREHIVWFEDARSIQAKFDAVKSYRLRGISYWVLGLSFTQNWYALESNFTVKKLI